PDCNGICNGPGYFGDTYSDQTLNAQDVETYLDMIQSSFPSATCYDLNADGELSVMDAALVNWCRNGNPNHPGGSVHNHCQFPRSIVNPNDSMALTITDIDFSANYLDVAIRNPLYGLKGYQFEMSGINISSVVSLANPVEFPVDVRFLTGSSQVFAVSLQDSMLDRSTGFQPLVRIYFSSITDTTICISRVLDLVNEMAEDATPVLENACRSSMTTSIAPILSPADIAIVPNPANDRAFIHLPETGSPLTTLELLDMAGRSFSVPVSPLHDQWYSADLSKLSQGVYLLRIMTPSQQGVARLVRQ
ncbi:MAG TPA: T9SS type A sorting domain-containing protein, partial [Bacteroidia bacterium]|nr:T9SS type A sorting domain-containing protein [Bacteroidia bacterium]